MSQNRRSVLEELAAQLATVSGVTAVQRSYGEIDITQKASTDLPLIEIIEPEEDTYSEMTGQRNLMQLMANLRIWFVDWNDTPQAAYGTLMKNIRDKLGSQFKLGNSAIVCRVDSISAVEGILPRWNFSMVLELRYYMNEQST